MIQWLDFIKHMRFNKNRGFTGCRGFAERRGFTAYRGFTERRGFTLIETLVALVITVSTGMILANAWSGNYKRIRKSTLKLNVTQLLERKMVEIEAKNYRKKITEIKEEEGNFGKDFPQYRWTFSTQPFVMPDLAPLLTSKSEGADQMLLTVLKKMQEAVNKAVLEGTVTVYVNYAGKEINYSVTTYFVDFESEINTDASGV